MAEYMIQEIEVKNEESPDLDIGRKVILMDGEIIEEYIVYETSSDLKGVMTEKCKIKEDHAARNNTSPPFTANKMLALLQEAINNVQREDWLKVVNKTKRDIMYDWDRDIHIDNIMESSLIISVTDSDYEFNNNLDVPDSATF
ncbi:unnamed protein product [Parnassius apollo]|uniref:(apollo) hypothetical protein n=1 Tax=Parnassius apollo TaxID=110799 RepID=A0A8S3W917_PARAO|nr:unnamed protein product [Parnassius apollo]